MRKIMLFLFVCVSGIANAQDLVITNARIIDGTGNVFDSGSVVISDGRIVSVSSEEANISDVPRIDANGMTVMAGFIDAHRHIIRGDAEAWFREQSVDRVQEFLDAGFTTLMEGGGRIPSIIELKRLIDMGQLTGPRVITSARADPLQYNTEEVARARVQELAEAGVEIIKARVTPAEKELLAILVNEARKYDLDVMVHAVTVPDMIAAVEAGAGKLVHTPHDSFMTVAEARMVADANIENLSTVGFAVPTVDVFNDDNVPTFRDGSPWPESILGTGSNAAGEKAVNA